ncbi:MAG: type I-G CRISPR-associated protein Csb2 [Acidobacteriota bacterium]
MLTLAWTYLTGYARATDPARREAAEWPPHPARVWLALAAAFFETGEDPAEEQALEWLRTLPHPQLWLPRQAGGRRRVINTYVPINDRAEGTAGLQSAPLFRSKQPRTFPAVWVGDQPCFLHWPEAPESDRHRPALAQLCAKVTRIGHAASLVQMWVAEALPRPEEGFEGWLPTANDDDDLAHLQLRQVFQGPSLEHLREAFQTGRRPLVGLATGYRPAALASPPMVRTTAFDHDLLVLTQIDGPTLPAVAALQVMQALRDTLMAHCPQSPPAWLSGHDDQGRPLADGRLHLAIFPLPFVGHEYADGRLLGVALAFPRELDRRERSGALSSLLVNQQGKLADITLKLGRLGVCVLRKRAWEDTRLTLRPETWTGFPQGTQRWASVTPVVLDRFPKANRLTERLAWEREVGAILFDACRYAGLPEPVEIDFGTTAWHSGAPRAFTRERPLRGAPPRFPVTHARSGDGFPPYPARGVGASKPQLHVFLRFAEPVVGPVLLGAGRFFGYGLFKPLDSKRS